MAIAMERVTIRLPSELKKKVEWWVIQRRFFDGQRDASLNGVIVTAIEGWLRREDAKIAKAQEQAKTSAPVSQEG
jgi:Arc/MetJ-type ribon-helix-helix transcriptional regulator